MISEDLKALLSHKDEKVRDLARAYEYIMASPYYDAYMTLREQLNDWNRQLKIGEEQTISVGGVDVKVRKGQIDLFASNEEKSFDRAYKYFDSILELSDKLEKLKSKLTPEEERKIIEEAVGVSYEKARGKAMEGKK